MPIPDFQTLMLPLLQIAGDGLEHSISDARTPLAEQFALTESERTERLAIGRQSRFNNRVAWSKVYLERAGLLVPTRRGHFRITAAGQRVLAEPPPKLTIAFLRQFPGFEPRRNQCADDASGEIVASQDTTPLEALDLAYRKLRAELATKLLAQVRSSSPEFFEQLVLDLMVNMGYGCDDSAASPTPRGADGGIDGVINQDRLGLEVIYLQAKRWEDSVGRPEIHRFVGALQGRRAKKGVFIITSSFTREAIDYAAGIDPKVVLIDGNRLAQLMMDFNVGVSRHQSFEIKQMDTDYFSEE